MAKYIIIWNTEKEEFESETMEQVELYANNLITEGYYWVSITRVSD